MRLSRNSARRAALRAGALAALCGGALAAGAWGERVDRRVGAMGTGLTLEVEARTRAEALAASEAAVRAIGAVEARLSTWRDDSELARLNCAPVGEIVAVSPALRADLELCDRWWRATAGAFDPNVGALVEAWDLRGAGRIPTADQLASARAAGDFAQGFALEPGGCVRRRERARLEEGGFGKGVGLDAALDALRARGVTSAVLDLGGQVALLGGSRLRWSVAHPQRREQAVLAWDFERGSIATSGNSERARVVDGRRIGHLLDPRSGEPAPDLGSVSVWAERAADADVLSTALFVMGPRKACEFAAARDDFALVWLERTPQGLTVHASESLRTALSVLDGSVQLEFIPPAPERTRDGVSLSDPQREPSSL